MGGRVRWRQVGWVALGLAAVWNPARISAREMIDDSVELAAPLRENETLAPADVASPPAFGQSSPSAGVGLGPLIEQEEPVDIGRLVEDYLANRPETRLGFPEYENLPPPLSTDPLAMGPRWNHGLEWVSQDEGFRFHVGGRYQFDTAWFGADRSVQENINIPYGDGVDFRRARFRMDGTIYHLIDFATEIDFVNSFRAAAPQASATQPDFTENVTIGLTDFWWQLRDVPLLGTVRIGQQKEPIGLEHLVSSRFLPFMERSFNQDTFYGGTFNGFTPGISASRTYGLHDDGVIHYGLFKPTNNIFGESTGSGDYSVVGRLTRLWDYRDGGRFLVHTAVSGKQATAVSQAGFPGRLQTYRTRDAVRSGLSQDWTVPAGIVLYGDDYQQVNAELAIVAGPWTLQSEYLVSGHQDARQSLDDPVAGTVVYHGGYIQLFRFLTNDYDRYDKTTATFGRMLPSDQFARRRDGGWRRYAGGAFQVGARYNFLDLNDLGLNGGVLHNQTYGVNWFLNPNLKAQFNYSATYRDVAQTTSFPDGSGWVHGFGTRIAMDF